MIAVSVKQPWAWAIYEGFKRIETRTWTTDYRGDLLIVSSKLPDRAMLDSFKSEYGISLDDKMIYGQALAIAELVDCRPMTEADQKAALCDIYPNAQAWVLKNIRKINPFPVKGQLGLYEVEVPESVLKGLYV